MAYFPIEIPSRSALCAGCGARFEPCAHYTSVLHEEKEAVLSRQDFCTACRAKAEEKRGVTSWKGRVPEKIVEEDPFQSRDEKALALLKESATEEEQGERQQEAFILALYLARKRQLALRKELERKGERIFLYEVVETEEMIPVRQFKLTQLQTENIQAVLARKLKVNRGHAPR